MQKNDKRARIGIYSYWREALAKLISLQKQN